MPSFLLSLAAGLGIPAPFRKAAVIAAGVLLLLLAIFAAVKIHDHRVIAQHQAAQDASNAKADRKADAKAAEQRRTDDSRLTQEAGQLKEAQTNAHTDHDRSLARARCIRLQQSARAAKREPPSCLGSGVPS
jgi:hypothetical protein